MFSTTLGGTQVNPSALSGIAQGLSSSQFSGLAGNITDLGNIDLSSLANFTSGFDPSRAIPGALASVANSAFDLGSEVLKQPLASVGDTSLLPSNSSAPESLTVEDITDPETIPSDWVFVTAPQDVSWDKQGQLSPVDNFGTNSPYVIYSSTGMRKLTLGEVLIEGFSAGKEVENHIIKLESMMNMVMNSEVGYVSPYVWDLRAGDKSYGKFVIESLQIKEAMRNEKGRADRAVASISLQQVPDFQVNDGRDLATQADLASGKSIVSEKDKKAEADGKGGSKAKAQSDGAGGGESGSSDGSSPSGDKDPRPVKPPELQPQDFAQRALENAIILRDSSGG
jgi:hypothetical protein